MSNKTNRGKSTTSEIKEEVVNPVVEEVETKEEIEETSTVVKIGVVANCKALNIRKGPSLDSEIVKVLNNNAIVQILDTENDFYKVEFAKDQIGYGMQKFIEVKE